MEKINIAELLKDCPKGMELDCTMFDNVTFEGLNTADYPINIKVMGDDCYKYLTKTGCWNNNDNAKCVIFPKGKTTWEGFVPPCKFKDGDIVTCTNDACTYTAIFKEMIDKGAFCHYGVLVDNKFRCRVNDWSDFNETCRLATEEEKQKLFDAIKANGYKWNAETKTLEKLPKFKVGDRVKKKDSNEDVVLITDIADNYYIVETKYGMEVTISISIQNDYELVPNKFDINTLVPFESKVLVRDNNLQKWSPAMWGYYDFDSQDYPYKLVGGCARYCIPYEVNQHLLGTTDDCDEFYKTW